MSHEKEQAPLLELYLTYDQWKEKHDSLYARLMELCRCMRWNPSNYECANWESHHRLVRATFIPFMEEWKKYVQQEKLTIYPFAKASIRGDESSPVTPLEEDDRLVTLFYEHYVRAYEEGATPEDSLARVMQVLLIVTEHFRIEDETILPITEKLMEDLAYSGS
ncbi:hypothetical protein [Cohnella soli]|uniref:Hemerythrin domain-containing protein n=1 Tax=Cohnella soli TaxID=425005 RepID=A0ABW0HZY3_9BACL